MQNLSLFENNSQPFIVNNHLSFNFHDYTNTNPNLTTFHSIAKTKSYTPITGCVLEHIVTATNLTNYEKLYYLLADSLSLINKNRGESRYCALPSEDWADRLGCSRSLVFTMQKSLVKKGYFIINKDFDEIGRNERNLITPTLPTCVLNNLNEKFPDRVGDHAPYNRFVECKRSYLDRTKLFIKLNYGLLKIITASGYLNPRQKVIWLSFYTRCYKNCMLLAKEDLNLGKYSHNADSSFSFIASYKELADLYSCSTKYISKSIRALEELGFIKKQNIYVRKGCSNTRDHAIQERQDKSLWKISLSLPDECIAELEKVKNRSNLKLNGTKDDFVAIQNTVDPKSIADCLILGGIKFNLNLEQSDVLKSLIVDGDNDDGCSDGSEAANCDYNIELMQTNPSTESYIDSIMEELDGSDTDHTDGDLKKAIELKDIDFSSDTSVASSIPSFVEDFAAQKDRNGGIKSDPHVAKSGLLLNKDLLLKIKDIKSNLGASPKVLFNKFLKRFKKGESNNSSSNKKETAAVSREFNIHSQLIKEKLKLLPKDKADKARKFAYCIISKGLAKGYAASLSKHELAKQIIHHAASWKPTKLGSISREKEIDTALSVAWKKIVGGTWQVPLELAKAEILQYEFRHYRRKYKELGILSYEAKSLALDVNKLLGGWCDVVGKITDGCNAADKLEESTAGIRDVGDVGSYSSTTYSPLQLELEERDYRNNSNVGCDIKLDDFVPCEFNDIESHSFDCDFLEREESSNLSNLLSVDLSHISEKQKSLKVTSSSNDNSMKLETINLQEYFVKLKELKLNGQGDLVMTLKPLANKCFVDLSGNIKNNSVLDNNELKELSSKVDLNLNARTDADLQAMVTNSRTVKIDEVIGNLLKTIRIDDLCGQD